MGLLDSFKSLFSTSSKVDVHARFELLREAITGTMSKFYMARDRQSGQVVGLKILDPEKYAHFESRFQGLNKPGEGQIGQQVQHPLVVRTLEFGVTTHNEQYVVQEFLDGPGMHSLIVSRNREIVGRRVPLIRQAAEALGAVHAAGFIHRDVCPRNFVLSKDLRSLKLIDFGLTVPATAPFMQPGNRTGTANYMAPEVVRRRATSQKLDIYSFGATIYELLTFELPWPRGADGRAAMTHGTEVPTDIRQRYPNLHPKLAAAVMACLETEPGKRPESIAAFLQMIRGVESETA